MKIVSQLDENQVGFLVRMINAVYKESENDLWKDNHERITRTRLLEIIEKRELLLAIDDSEVLGCIHLEPMDKLMYKFKMLVANPKHKGTGVGSLLVSFAEQQAKKNGAKTMQLELLVPTDFLHSDKVFLRNWYSRIGYRKTAEHDVDFVHEGLSNLLKIGCVAEIYHKKL
ncbi:MAG: GNAT family N-acetyltransferase [Flavobacteriales bacterium]|nr:GNAT family N-acetyltransferase [Flavobacteriales bacterium]